MIKALTNLEEYIDLLGIDETEAEGEIVYLYLAIQLKPLVGIAGINENRLNNIIEFLAENYFEEDLSLDLQINALYNYVNTIKTCPSNFLLTDGIEILLERYAETK